MKDFAKIFKRDHVSDKIMRAIKERVTLLRKEREEEARWKKKNEVDSFVFVKQKTLQGIQRMMTKRASIVEERNLKDRSNSPSNYMLSGDGKRTTAPTSGLVSRLSSRMDYGGI